jgi:5-methylcytosine-specific restriction endonuclease McrA
MTGDKPLYLDDIPPDRRTYPAGWRDAAIRELFDNAAGGVACPRCTAVFAGRARLRSLHSDHIEPFSRGGRTTWANLQLLCGPCNLQKSDEMPGNRP